MLITETQRYPLYRRVGKSQDRSGRVQKTLLLPVFDPPTVQAVASRYTDCAIPAVTVSPNSRLSRGYHAEGCILLFSVDRSPCTVLLAILS
jgi:hypothetical protein